MSTCSGDVPTNIRRIDLRRVYNVETPSPDRRRRVNKELRFYQPCQRFMLAGGIYGRCPQYPWRACRTPRIFRTCIHVDFSTPFYEFRERSENRRAYDATLMVPIFAYQWRLRPRWNPPPRPSKAIVAQQYTVEWKLAA